MHAWLLKARLLVAREGCERMTGQLSHPRGKHISCNTQVVACPHLYDVQFNFFTSYMLTALRPVMVFGSNKSEPITAEGFELMTVIP